MPVDYNTHELAWAAGFWDGEGYTGVTPRTSNGQPQVHMKLGQSGDSSLLERFQEAIGGLGTLQGPYQRYNKTTGEPYMPTYMWQSSKHEHMQQVIACLWPWLGDVKKKQMHAATLAARAWFSRR